MTCKNAPSLSTLQNMLSYDDIKILPVEECIDDNDSLELTCGNTKAIYRYGNLVSDYTFPGVMRLGMLGIL